jgi:preprotein translocase subunit SecD
MKSVNFIIASFIFALSSASVAQPSGVECRLEAKKDGLEFKWGDGKVVKLESSAFMSGSDFIKAIARDPKDPNSPGKYEIDLLHSESGKKKFRDVANQDRARGYCIVFESTILQCYDFPPEVKGLYEKGSSIYGPFSKAEAEKLAVAINNSLH